MGGLSCLPLDSCPDPSANNGSVLNVSCSRTCDAPSRANGGLDCIDPEGDAKTDLCMSKSSMGLN